ncbi:MAG: type II toxin-antitoxin system VapC family toxin [Nanoarchaeota archaeon]
MFVDANIFLEILLEDQHYQQSEIFLLNALEKKQALYTSDFVVYSCLLVLESRLHSVEKMRDFLISLHSLNIIVLHPSLKAMEESFIFIKSYNLDFDDALVLGCMLENDIKELISYDKDFTNVKEIKIIQP